ncbi:MAG: hypothetical protein J3K34DRAFT_442890 [Monoraphidium minutum]|nr:MAG: hypothetical protein J3K34DRAFT_442890 [Monoraphidium minutum]
MRSALIAAFSALASLRREITASLIRSRSAGFVLNMPCSPRIMSPPTAAQPARSSWPVAGGASSTSPSCADTCSSCASSACALRSASKRPASTAPGARTSTSAPSTSGAA